MLDVIDRIRGANVEFWVEGGWGIDALLGEETRVHDDLDLGVRREHVAGLCASLPDFARIGDEWPSRLVLRDPRGRKVDVHPLTFDDAGDGWQANASGGAPYRWPGEDLTALGTICSVEVPCITAEPQVRWHVYPEVDDVDWQDVARLVERFGLSPPPHLRERPGFVAKKRVRARLR